MGGGVVIYGCSPEIGLMAGVDNPGDCRASGVLSHAIISALTLFNRFAGFTTVFTPQEGVLHFRVSQLLTDNTWLNWTIGEDTAKPVNLTALYVPSSAPLLGSQWRII